MLPGIILCLLGVELALNDRQQRGKRKLVNQTATVYWAVLGIKTAFIRQTAKCYVCLLTDCRGKEAHSSWKQHLLDSIGTTNR